MRVMHVGNVRMSVPQPFVPMHMRVRFSRRIAGSMFVLVMMVVDMRMRVFHRLM